MGRHKGLHTREDRRVTVGASRPSSRPAHRGVLYSGTRSRDIVLNPMDGSASGAQPSFVARRGGSSYSTEVTGRVKREVLARHMDRVVSKYLNIHVSSSLCLL